MGTILMILTNEFDPDVRVYKEAKYLISKQFNVTILCWNKDVLRGYPQYENIDGIEVIRFNIPSIAGSGYKQICAFIRFIKQCRQYLSKNNIDYLHCHDIDGAIAGYFAKRRKTPMLFDMHEFYEKGGILSRCLWRNLTIFLLKKSFAGLYENAIYLSKKYKKIHSILYPLKNYPDGDLIKAYSKSQSEVFRIGYHGSARSQATEFKALFEAVKGYDDVRVDINGEGPDFQYLYELEPRYDNVYIHGIFDGRTALSKLYESTDVLFCGYNPNLLNFQGDAEVVKFYEAIYTGTPMIITKHIGMGEKVEKNLYGIACDTQDPVSIRKAVLKLKNDKEFWENCSRNELQNAYKYDWNRAVKVLDSIYLNN